MIIDKFQTGNKKILKILMLLFNTCNNRCSFCFENGYGNRLDSLENFKANSKYYAEKLNEIICQNPRQFDAIDIKLIGGELFFDSSVKDGLWSILDSIQFSNTITWHIGTNLLYNDNKFLVETIDKLESSGFNIRLYSSYDFGNERFSNQESFEMFYKNIKDLIAHYSRRYDLKNSTHFQMCIETIKTKHMLRSLQQKDEQYLIFRELASSINVTFAQLIGDYDFALTFDESVQLWKLLIRDFAGEIAELKQLQCMPKRNCFNITRYTITKDGIYTGCLAQKSSLVNTTCEDRSRMAKEMLSRYNCMTCKYFKMCNLVCPYERLYDRCDLFEVLNYISENGIQL